MRAGRLRYRGNIEQRAPVVEGTLGQPVPSWTIFKAGVWHGIEPVTGTERTIGKEVVGTATHILPMRAIDGIDPTMRMNYDNGARIFNFVAVLHERNHPEDLLVTAVEEVPKRG